jgi:sodium-dependent dicarboxylate transporter 2/3/5
MSVLLPIKSQEPSSISRTPLKRVAAVGVGPLLALAIFFLLPDSLAVEARAVAATGALMAAWWITEAVPAAVASLLPVVLFPFLGVAPIGESVAPYADSIVFLILGGVLLGLGVQRWNLHHRMALATILLFGTRPSQIVLGLMVASGFISAWVSNTATAVIMVPIGLSVITLVKSVTKASITKFSASILLGIAYGTTLGGFATLIGQPHNPIVAAYLQDKFDITIGFGQWLIFGLPFAVTFTAIAWLVLCKFVFRAEIDEIPGGKEMFREELQKLGSLGVEEKRVMALFVLALFGWLVVPFIAEIPSVASAVPWVANINDTSVAVLVGLLMFMVPASKEKTGMLLSWKDTDEVPWGVLILIGGGMALSKQISASGLSAWIGGQMGGLDIFPTVILLTVVAAVLIVLSELASNTAVAAAFLPVMGAVAVSAAIDPVLMAMTVAMAVTCSFMLPVATPSNSVAYATGELELRDMVRAGIWLNVAGLALTIGMLYTFIPLTFGVAP